MWRLLALVFMLFALGEAAWAQWSEDAQKCAEHAQTNPDLALQYCSRAIQSGQLSTGNLAGTFYNRGNAYGRKGDYDRAIQDYDQAIRLNPNYANAFNNRGNAYRNKQDYDRALADYEAAARIDPKVARHRSMGHSLFYLGRIVESAKVMEQAVKAAPQDMYAIFWRYMAQAKSGDVQVASREFGENAAQLKESGWPAPVIDFYVGKIEEKAMYAAAENPDLKKNGEQLCEANFYTAEAKLLKGATEEAIPLLRAAEEDCPPTFYEAHGARAELKQLGQR